jgi:hypothetical protein
MTSEDRATLRRLYSEACHGAGAIPRFEARIQIDAMLSRCGMTLKEALDSERLDLGAYFASRPISS